jgi:large subunit ribosomal protein L6
MSRLAKKGLVIPDGVKVSVQGNKYLVEGKLGKIQQDFLSHYVDISVQEKEVMVNRKGDSNVHRASQGLYWSLIRNSIMGVSQGFSKTLLIQGLGYKWELKGKDLVLTVGFSKPAVYKIPEGVILKVENLNTLVVSGHDKHLVGQVAANIRAIKPPEPYKGKGVRYSDEQIKLKEGKSAK